MSELATLHRRLRRALMLSPLLVGATSLACTSTKGPDEPAEGKGRLSFGGDRDEERQDEDDPSADGPSTALPPEEHRLPACPHGEWCGTKELAEALRRPADEYYKPADDIGGCPGAIVGKDGLTPEQVEAYTDLPVHGGMIATLDAEATKSRQAAGNEDSCCYEWSEMCPGGRPLLDGERRVLAELRPGSSWSAPLPGLDRRALDALDEPLRRRLAAAWLEDARSEHASIASFARARAELIAVGAPAALVTACERAAEDEVRHARICFALAARYGRRALEPAAMPSLPPRAGGPAELEAVIRATFIEGCVGETVAAACVARAAAEARDPELGALLATIAADESEHAALAWQTLAWAVEREPAIHASLRRAAAELRPELDAPLPPEDELRRALAEHGRLDARSLEQLRRRAWVEIIDPLLAELAPAEGPVAELTLREA